MEMFGIQNMTKISGFYTNICSHINDWLNEHKLSEFEKVFVTKDKRPVIGLHSTTTRSLELILEEGFNVRHPEAKISGYVGSSPGKNKDFVGDDWSEAKFASPYGDKQGKRNSNHYISYTIGIARNIQPVFLFFDKHGINLNKLLELYPEGYVEFPMIISAFKDTSDKKIKVNPYGWIECWDPDEQCILLGVIYVKFTFDQIVDMYTDKYYDVFVIKNEMDYRIEWFDEFRQDYVVVR